MTKLQYLKQWAREHDFIRRVRETFDDFPDRGGRTRKWIKEWMLYGFSSRQTWGLDTQISRYILPRLKMLKDIKCGYPSILTEDEWDAVLDDIIYALEWSALDGLHDYIEDRERITRGFELLGKHYLDLWW